VASNICKAAIQGLMKDGIVRRGYLGLQAREMTPAEAAKAKKNGVLVVDVIANTPAAKAGLRSGDIITAVAGRPTADTRTLQAIIVSLPLKQTVQMSIVRSGKALTLLVTIEELPGDFNLPQPPMPAYNKVPFPGFLDERAHV
jgi:serine protease Do